MSLGQELAPHLPFLRRYARALTGSQTHGDAFVRATLEAIVAAPDSFPREVEPRLGLYKTFHAIWSTANIEEGGIDDNGLGNPEAIAQARPELRTTELHKPVTMLLFGMMNWMFTWLQPGGKLTHAAMAPVVADLFFGGLNSVHVAGSQPRPEPAPAKRIARRA